MKKGATRFVFLVGRYAIKVPAFSFKRTFYGTFYRFLQGWLGNRTEYLWSRSGTFDYLCKVRLSLCLSLVIVMERADELSREEFEGLDRTKYEFGNIEWKRTSFGKIDGKIVVIDYGN